MGGSAGATKSATEQNSTQSTNYGNTSTSNPYIISSTNNGGTVTRFQDGSALKTVNDFINNNIQGLLEEYLNPNINTAANQARINAYTDTMKDVTNKALENNVIAPLVKRNMLKSSQATNLYRDLANQQTKGISDFTNNLVSNSQNNTADILNNLMNYVFQGWNVINGNQALSLDTSRGNSTTNGNISTRTNTSGYGANAKASNFI